MPTHDFPLHVRLMLLACGTPSPAELRRAVEEVDRWDEFIAVTLHHRLGPRVLACLRTVTGLAVPLQVRFALEHKDRANRAHLARLLEEYERIHRHFATNGFPVAVLKGAPLAVLSSGDAFARHAGDLDLLTGERDLSRQVQLMEELGYSAREPHVRMTARRLATYWKYWKGIEFRNPELGLSVDLHWRLFHNHLHPANALKEVAPILVQGVEMRAHPLADQLLYGAAHGAWDLWVYLKGLADVAACLRRLRGPELDGALARARGLGLLPQVSSAVWLAREWMGSEARSGLLLGEDDGFHVAMRARVLAGLVAAEYRPRRVARGWVAAARAELGLVPGLASGVEIVRRYVWRPRTWPLLDLPDKLFWLTPVVGAVVPPRVRRGGEG